VSGRGSGLFLSRKEKREKNRYYLSPAITRKREEILHPLLSGGKSGCGVVLEEKRKKKGKNSVLTRERM